ncbi:PepSY domain-containing protein [Methylovorus menthalis]|uniref:PepSY domain-containing protein n=1 Tax=Methylovorus menthalis TaxID=1002227 RepID=UPI001E610DEB|nr:PepSY domain-containing protein [Methylovorus menthalis]MCB4812062.1 PepSY domain-containing protein [Methylovorus menthalis]
MKLRSWSLGALLLLSVLNVHAAADCPAYPKEEWASEDTLKDALAQEGYKIKKFKVDGNCYEIYGWNKQGKKVEIYFDMKTFAIIKAEVER